MIKIENVIPFDFYKYDPDMDMNRYYNYSVKRKEKLIRGAKYMLNGRRIMNFHMPTYVYEIIALVNSVNGVELNSVVAKQVEGPDDVDAHFALTLKDCEILHVHYQPGLRLFSNNLNWKRVSSVLKTGKIKNFDFKNLGTYPVSRIDGTVRYMMVKIPNFYIENKNIHCIDFDRNYGYNDFVNRIHVITKANIIYKKDSFSKNILLFKKNEEVPFRILNKNFKGIQDDPDFHNCLYLEMQLKKPIKGLFSEDGYFGITSNILEGKKFNDVFEITFNDGIKTSEIRKFIKNN